MYSFNQSEQLNLFLLSLGLGFILGILYDILRTVRLTFGKSKILIFIFDILYFAVFSLLTFLFFLATNKGEFRSYMILGEILGWLFYYFSFGIAAKTFSEHFVKVTRKLFKTVFIVLTFPFRLIFKLFLKIKSIFSAFFGKTSKKVKKNTKKHLQKVRLYVYNLSGIFKRRKDFKKKGGHGLDKNQEKKEE